jgi:ABC-type molybdenum transport system ATPase subunit/photorepair protein PhrA
VSRLEAQAKDTHVTLLANTVEQGSSLREIKKDVSVIQSSVNQQSKEQTLHEDRVMTKMDVAITSLKRVSEKAEKVQATVISFRSLGEQLFQLYVNEFWTGLITNSIIRVHDLPVQIREVLEQVV